MLTTDPPPILPARDPKGHKGTFGTVCVLGGCAASPHMVGGPALAAIGALRAGAGLVRLAMPEPILDAGLTIAPSATGVAIAVDGVGEIEGHEAARVIDEQVASCQCLAIGPGLGKGAGPRAASLRAVTQEAAPVVLDADALNNLADAPDLRRDFHATSILTPHPGEFQRLAAALGLGLPADASTSDASRPIAAEKLAQTLGCVVVLKGAGTVVSDGQRTWVNDTGSAALAAGGSGDVLCGVISGLVSQFHRRPLGAGSFTVTSERQGGLSLFDCARIGVRAHGLAADRWVKRTGASAGLLAAELAEEIPAALEQMRQADAADRVAT